MIEVPDNGTHHHHHTFHGPHIDALVDESISKLAPFSGLILTITTVLVFAYRLYFIEKFLMNTRSYRGRYQALSEDQRRSLVNHHVAGTCKIILLISAIYPFLSIAFGRATPHTPFTPGSRVTMGDVMIVCSQLFTVMYIFELFYRVNVSPISAAHHVGAIVIAQSAVAISLNFDHEQDAVIEFIMCFVWGAFDCIAELWPHIAMILYRLLPPSDEHSKRARHFHGLMSRLFFSVAVMEIVGTTLETTVVFWLFGSLWHKWTLSFKVVTPILHVLFSCAQLWGAWVFWNLSKKEARKAAGLLSSGVTQIEDGEVGAIERLKSGGPLVSTTKV
ncbi:hypothetical protein LTR05_000858 [Lithohypha guttulata]|uniref:TLC domain-containing protein n=1 Tax=Lithohypha guttulata TaxID=1690604 RepID=A0AAN7T5T4_9EURO|nr:hypothetical protein LTR05_000858 [Lithohypha guttulata]